MNETRWICRTCGWIYDQAEGDPDSGIAPGTAFEDIPDDWMCPLCGVTKADFEPFVPMARTEARARPRRRAAGAGKPGGDDAIVIVGGGIAGWSAAQALREQLADVPITLICADSGDVYPKPSLSMALRQGRDAESLIERHGEEQARQLNVRLLPNTRLLSIKPEARRLLSSAGSIRYGKLVLALGAAPIRPRLDGDAADALLAVNHLDDYRRLRSRCDQGPRKILIVGAGLIGCELAEDLAADGHRITVTDLAERPMARLLPPAMSDALLQSWAPLGIGFLPGTGLTALNHGEDESLQATFSDQRTETFDLVIGAIGLAPNTAAAAKAGLDVNRGILANADTLQTSAAHVHALGDCVEIEGQTQAYIEPIRRQCQTLAAALSGRLQAFEATRPVAIRVKTSGLPINVCPPPAGASGGEWVTVHRQQGNQCHEYRRDGQLLGYAVSGDQAARGVDLHQRVLESLMDGPAPSRAA